MRRSCIAVIALVLGSLPALIGGGPERALAAGKGYDLWAEQRVPAGGPAACIQGGAGSCSESYVEVTQYASTPGFVPTWIDLFCQTWSRDAGGVLHTSEAEVITSIGGGIKTVSTSGLGLLIKEGPSTTTGSEGLFLVQGSDTGTVPGNGIWGGTPYANSGSAFGLFQGGSIGTSSSDPRFGRMTEGFITATITGTIFHAHWAGNRIVSDGTTQGSMSCSVSPGANTDVYADLTA